MSVQDLQHFVLGDSEGVWRQFTIRFREGCAYRVSCKIILPGAAPQACAYCRAAPNVPRMSVTQSKMKILEVGWEGSIGIGHMGPVTNAIFQLARSFAELGHDVTLATGPATEERVLLPGEVTVVECASATSLWKDRVALRTNRLSRGLKRNSQYGYMTELASKLDLGSFDVIHTHMESHAALLQKVFRRRCAYTIHTPLWADKSLYRGVRGFVRYAIRRCEIAARIHEINVIQEAWLAVALGQFVRQEVQRGNIAVIPNGISLSEWPVIERGAARAELGLGNEEFLIVFAASIRPVKGLDVLLRAVEYLANKGVEVKLIVLGHFSKELEQQVRGLPVDLRGFVSNRSRTFRAYLSAADVVVVPSRFDNQPTVVLEAMAMGVPVIASRVGGIPDMVSEDVGMLFESENHVELAESLEHLRREPSRREALARQCRQRIEDKFTWNASARAYIAAFERTLAENGTSEAPS